MDFKNATDILFANIGHNELAKRLPSSVAAIRQARLAKSAKAYRAPPKGWDRAVIDAADAKITALQELIEALRRTGSG